MIAGTDAFYEGKTAHATTVSSSYTTWANGDIMQIALDMDSGKIWWGKNGTWLNSGNPEAGTGEMYSGISGVVAPVVDCLTSDVSIADFGQLGFTYTPPADFLALSTANLPEPTIGPNSDTLSDENFDTVLYVGNGTAIGSGGKSVTGVGFQPDMV